MADRRGDHALSVYASLSEGLALIRSDGGDRAERLRDCMAQAAKYQFDPSVKIAQLEILGMLLDVVSMLHRENPEITSQKLRVLQKTLDECGSWHNVRADFMIPIKKQNSTQRVLSDDTSSIVLMGKGGEDDFLVMSFMTKMEMMTLV